jgi:hypothetical protein
MTEKKVKRTSLFTIVVKPFMRFIELNRPKTENYRIKFMLDGVRYSIDINVFDNKETSARELANNKFDINKHSAFSDENIPPHQFENLKSGLESWACRYRWVDGANAPYRRHELFMEIEDKIAHFSYMAKPENFDMGLIEFFEIIKSVEPV